MLQLKDQRLLVLANEIHLHFDILCNCTAVVHINVILHVKVIAPHFTWYRSKYHKQVQSEHVKYQDTLIEQSLELQPAHVHPACIIIIISKVCSDIH